jgi:uncharacterized protein
VAILVDTGIVVALADLSDPYHPRVATFVRNTREPLLIPVTVLPEVDYLLTKDLGGAAALGALRSVAAGEFQLQEFSSADLTRCVDLMVQYADSNIGLVDASIMAIAERLRITRILTLDERHFRMIRPRHCVAFELLPPPTPA